MRASHSKAVAKLRREASSRTHKAVSTATRDAGTMLQAQWSAHLDDVRAREAALAEREGAASRREAAVHATEVEQAARVSRSIGVQTRKQLLIEGVDPRTAAKMQALQVSLCTACFC